MENIKQQEHDRHLYLDKLRKINPEKYKDYIDTIITAGAGASKTFLSDVSYWLTEKLGLEQAAHIMNDFHRKNCKPFFITTKEKSPFEENDPSTNEVELIVEYEDNSRKKLSFIKLNSTQESGLIEPFLQLEDQLKWENSKTWWTLVEIKKNEKTLLLLNYKKYEYKKIFLIQLYGVIVKRKIKIDSEESSSDSEICFQFPKPDFIKTLALLPQEVSEAKTINNALLNNNTIKMKKNESSSALKVWKQQKNHTLKAKLLLSELSTDLLSDKTIWLQVGRALKSLSKGSQSLLTDWVSWTKKSQNNIVTASSCKPIWESFRPKTNSDEDSIVKLRSFFKVYDFSNKHSGEKVLAENSVPLTLAEIKEEMLLEINPKQKKLIKEMNEVFDYVSYVDKKEIVFYSSENDFSNINMVKDSRPSEIEVAMEEYKLRIESNTIKQTIHVSTSKVIPSLIVGDYVHLPNLSSYHSSDKTNKRLDNWFKIIDVDIIFARVRVTPTVAPPECFIYTGTSTNNSKNPFWIPISNFWAVLVFRKLKTPDESFRYITFLTPIVSHETTLAFLSSLPSAPKGKPSEKELNKNYILNTQTLQVNSNAIVLAWNLIRPDKEENANVCLRSDSLKDLVYTLSLSQCNNNQFESLNWREIYRGSSEACQITSLLPLHQYQVKITARLKTGSVVTKYILLATTAAKPADSPKIINWFVGMKPGMIRLSGNIKKTKDDPNLLDNLQLPNDCMYVFEYLMIESYSMSDDAENVLDLLFKKSSTQDLDAYEIIECKDQTIIQSEFSSNVLLWKELGRCRCGLLNGIVSVSNYLNPVLFVRYRILNQYGILSESSPSMIFTLLKASPLP